MITPRQKARQEINRLLDEMIADLRKIKCFTLHMDKGAIEIIKKRSAHQLDQLVAIYDVLDAIGLPADKVITADEQLKLD